MILNADSDSSSFVANPQVVADEIRRLEKVAVVDSRMASSRRVVRASRRTWWAIRVASRTSAVKAMPACAAVCGLLVGLILLTTPSMSRSVFPLHWFTKKSGRNSKKLSGTEQTGKWRNQGPKQTATEEVPDIWDVYVHEDDHKINEKIGRNKLLVPNKSWVRQRTKNYKGDFKLLVAQKTNDAWISSAKGYSYCPVWTTTIRLIFEAAYAFGASTNTNLLKHSCCVACGSRDMAKKCDKSNQVWKQYVNQLEVSGPCKEMICRGLEAAEKTCNVSGN